MCNYSYPKISSLKEKLKLKHWTIITCRNSSLPGMTINIMNNKSLKAKEVSKYYEWIGNNYSLSNILHSEGTNYIYLFLPLSLYLFNHLSIIIIVIIDSCALKADCKLHIYIKIYKLGFTQAHTTLQINKKTGMDK